MRRVLFWVFGLCVLAVLVGAAVIGGYYIRDRHVTPLADLLPRVERKLAGMSGAPSELEAAMAVIETTFVQLSGRVLRAPDMHWEKGGALAVRGGDLVHMDRRGSFYATDGQAVPQRLPAIVAPENGRSAYEAFAQSPEGRKYTHSTERLRFNDVLFVTGARAGLVLSYSFFDPDRLCYGTRVAFAALASGTALERAEIAATDWQVLFETTPCLQLNRGHDAIEGHMAGGRLAFAVPDTVYLGSGDYHLDGIRGRDGGVQSDETSYGKVIAIDLARGGGRNVSKGHRNLQGVAIDRDGRLWVSEHGIRGGDELNLIEEGGNYGWPETTLGTLYSGQPVPEIAYGRHDRGIAPVFAWLPSAAVSSLAALDGVDPAWDGDLLAGSLSSSDFGRSLWRIRVSQGAERPVPDPGNSVVQRDNSVSDPSARVVFTERIRLGQRIRHVTQFGEEIAVLLDSNDLVIFEIARRPDALAEIRARIAAEVDPAIAGEVLDGFQRCSECHAYAENAHLAGPSLNGVVGRRVAGTGFADYSQALRDLTGSWTPERLAAYIANPEAVAPGSSMPASGLREGPVLDAMIDVLGRIDDAAGTDLTYN